MKKIYLLIPLILLIILAIILVLLNLSQPDEPTRLIKEFYKNKEESNFPLNSEIVKSPDFNPEIFKISEDGNDYKYGATYRGDTKLGRMLFGDFFYLERDNENNLRITKYETTNTSYFAQDNAISEDELYKSIKEQMQSGEIESGLEPQTVQQQTQAIIDQIGEGQIQKVVLARDNEKAIEFRNGSKYGENYLVDGQTGENLNKSNIYNGWLSTDGKLFFYTTATFQEVLGELIPNDDIWMADFQGVDKKIFESTDKPDSFSVFSEGEFILIGTKNKIYSSNKSDLDFKEIYSFTTVPVNYEDFYVPEFIDIENGKAIFEVYVEEGKKERVEVGL